jgi:hypothetical protein
MADQLSEPGLVSLATGTRQLPIEYSPLRQYNPWDADRRSVELQQAADDCLVLEPRKGAAFWHVPLILAGSVGSLASVSYLLLLELQGNANLATVLGLSFCLLFALGIFLVGVLAPHRFRRWVCFDRGNGVMTISRRPFSLRQGLQVIRSRPLKDIVCVQLLDAGWQSQNVEIGEPGTPGSVLHRNWHSYQFNLVMDDPHEPRPNLCGHSDVKWMREAGQRLAGFLGVPLIDRLPEGH